MGVYDSQHIASTDRKQRVNGKCWCSADPHFLFILSRRPDLGAVILVLGVGLLSDNTLGKHAHRHA